MARIDELRNLLGQAPCLDMGDKNLNSNDYARGSK